jgi:hypothetical protein
LDQSLVLVPVLGLGLTAYPIIFSRLNCFIICFNDWLGFVVTVCNGKSSNMTVLVTWLFGAANAVRRGMCGRRMTNLNLSGVEFFGVY